jgi:hypothetical protein
MGRLFMWCDIKKAGWCDEREEAQWTVTFLGAI